LEGTNGNDNKEPAPPPQQRLLNKRTELRKEWDGTRAPTLKWRFSKAWGGAERRRGELREAEELTRCIASDAPPDPKTPEGVAAIDTLLRMYEENTEHGRHIESERSSVNAFVVGASAAIAVLVLTKDFPDWLWFVPLSISLLGAYGLFTSVKLYERYDFHMKRARAFRRRVEAAQSVARIRQLRESSRIEQWLEYPVREGIRVHTLWLWLNVALIGMGITLTLLLPRVRPLQPPHVP